MSQAVMRTVDLVKRFDKKTVLDGLNMQIDAGQVVGLIGTNGAGKTTLIKCLLGLLKATSGSSKVFGEDSWDLSAAAKARLGYVSQEFVLLPWMTVQTMADYTGAFYENWDRRYVSMLINEWNLDPKQRVGALSVGQRQKLSVILALGHHPELLVLDEPVASLDPVARRQFLQSLIEFTEDEDNTIVFSTHITSDLERIASHVAFLADGKMGYFCELDELKHSVKRIRFMSDRLLPADFSYPGTLRLKVDGQQALLAVKDFQHDDLESFRSQLNADVTIEDLNLEEIFLELSGDAALQELEKVQ